MKTQKNSKDMPCAKNMLLENEGQNWIHELFASYFSVLFKENLMENCLVCIFLNLILSNLYENILQF